MASRDIHIKVEEEDLQRLKKFCLHRGDMTFLISQAIKYYGKKLETQGEKEDARVLREEGI